jgi:acyl carrier protein
MPVRFSCVVSTSSELLDRLKAWLDGHYQENTFFNDLENETPEVTKISEVSENQILPRMAKQWVLGEELSWSSVYPDKEDYKYRKIIPLPTYPFVRRYCWLPKTSKEDKSSVLAAVKNENGMDSEVPAANSSVTKPSGTDSPLPVEGHESASLTSISKKSDATGIEQRILQTISEILGMLPSELNKATPLKDLGVTSVTKMLIISAICENIDALDESNVSTALAQLDTVESIVSYIEDVLESKTEVDCQVHLPEKTHL